jgi:Mg2+ and Co2+ transporter CorA
VIARLFRAGEHEQQIDDPADLPREPRRHELLWVDVERGDESLEAGLAALGLEPAADRIRGDGSTPGVVRIEDVVHVTVLGLRQTEGDELPRPSRVEVLARGNAVLTLREEQVAGLGDLLELVEGRSELGSLDAATFTALLIEGLVHAFFVATDAIEHDIDELDQRALRATPNQAFVRELADLRRRIAILRRTLAPNRSVVAALARPELGLTPGGPDPWPALLERLERAIDELENARELLLGSFDLVMTRTAQRTNDVVRVLTVVSVTLLPAGVLAGIFGMNFPSPVFESGGLFVWAVAFIALVSTVILLVALWRRWL